MGDDEFQRRWGMPFTTRTYNTFMEHAKTRANWTKEHTTFVHYLCNQEVDHCVIKDRMLQTFPDLCEVVFQALKTDIPLAQAKQVAVIGHKISSSLHVKSKAYADREAVMAYDWGRELLPEFEIPSPEVDDVAEQLTRGLDWNWGLREVLDAKEVLGSQAFLIQSNTNHAPGTRSGKELVSRIFSTTTAGRNDQTPSNTDSASHSLDKRAVRIQDAIAEEKDKQTRAPWHREGSDIPPVARQRSAGAMTKGKLLTTPSRLLKLILPLTTLDKNSDRRDIEPLALLVHPQQPLSYLERLIQSELPSIPDGKGGNKIPAIHFRAEDSQQDQLTPKARASEEDDTVEDEEISTRLDATRFDGQVEKTGKLNRKTPQEAAELRGGPGEGGVESYSGLGREAEFSNEESFVRWSSSTEIGDFIRDAARGKEFAVEIEGSPENIRVGVPSFNDRTHYLRMRLRSISKRIADMAKVKQECDAAAHKQSQYVALGGFGFLGIYWFGVYWLTFKTDYGWDTMEPITYLVGLSTLICGYLWFLYHNREVSYRSALNLTISRRQNKLYALKQFDLGKWENLVEDGNALRKDIKAIAAEYDVDWDETADEGSKAVTEALKKRRDEKADGEKTRRGKDKEEADD